MKRLEIHGVKIKKKFFTIPTWVIKKIGKDYMKQSQKHFKILINEIKKKINIKDYSLAKNKLLRLQKIIIFFRYMNMEAIITQVFLTLTFS